LYIRRSDIRAYQNYGRDAIMAAGKNPTLPANDKRKAMASQIGQLMGGFFAEDEFSEDEGRQMLENLKAFTRDLRETQGDADDLEKNLKSFAAQKLTHASHGHNVAAYASYFGMALGLTNAEGLRLGGLLHDVGLGELPPELAVKDPSDMTSLELSKYKTHPLLAQANLDRLKLKLSADVLSMILHHHEHTDGSGFPFGLKSAEISAYAKVCALANEFDHLTSVRPGHPQLSPVEAIRKIAGLDGGPASPIYDKDFHAPLLNLFLKPIAPIAEAATSPPPSSLGSQVSISRLLKMPEFAKSSYMAELKCASPGLQSEMDLLSEQLKHHFKAKRASKTT
jgi:HD-GYP domain-containing protein (c-di-GMP phosphodiesterase class II)